jgi:hypothetical protein
VALTPSKSSLYQQYHGRLTKSPRLSFGEADFAARVRDRMMSEYAHILHPGWKQGAAVSQSPADHVLIFDVKGLLIEVPLTIEIKMTKPVVKSLKMKKSAQPTVNQGDGKPECYFGSYRAFRRKANTSSCEMIACCPARYVASNTIQFQTLTMTQEPGLAPGGSAGG